MSREKETVNGYEIKESITFTNNCGFALAENPNAPQPFVTWQFILFTSLKIIRDYVFNLR